MKNLFLVIFLISRIIYGENTKGSAWAKVEVLNKKVIIGEPIYIKLIKYATPYAGDIYLDGKKCDDPYVKALVEKSYYQFNKINDDKKIKVEEKIKEESFNILNNCDLMMKDMEEREYEVCYKDEWISACDRFSIEYPKGEDLKVFEKMGKEARDFTFPESKITTEELLEKYPTSTYAGWALARTTSGVYFGYSSGKELIDDILRPPKERIFSRGTIKKYDNGKKVIWVTPEEEAERYIDPAEKFLSFHSNHNLSAFIYARLALGYLVLHSWQEAYRCINESLKREWPEFLYTYKEVMHKQIRLLKEAKEELLKRGFVKEK